MCNKLVHLQSFKGYIAPNPFKHKQGLSKFSDDGREGGDFPMCLLVEQSGPVHPSAH